MKLLLHICCAPCSIMCIKKLREESIDVTGFWYNPNIHPYMEYRARKDTLRNYSEYINLKVIYNDVYGLDEFVKNVSNNIKGRCNILFLKLFIPFPKGTIVETFIEGFIFLPFIRYHTTYPISGINNKRYDILAKNISILTEQVI